jgi:LmbE family N-acetylglucosaminyl deacetylase
VLYLQLIEMSIVNILAIGAHPDDIEQGCGGLIVKAARSGHNVYMYTLTRGEAAGDPYRRVNELIESARVIGAKKLWIDNFPDTQLSVNSELINHIENIIQRTHADLVLTHSSYDIHHDHRATSAATIEAGRFAHNILAYEIPLSRDFKPQVFHDISDAINDKVSLISLFKSQRDKVYLNSNAIVGLASYRALQSRMNSTSENKEIDGIKHVEAYEVLKISLDNTLKLADTSTIVLENEYAAKPLDGVIEILPGLELFNSTYDQTPSKIGLV